VIRATFTTPTVTAASSDPGARTVAGTAVPWNVRGVVSDGTPVVFHPGSLDAGARPHLYRDHDPTRPLGMVVDAADNGQALTATARISRVRDGDEALILAADGVLGMFSVGVDPTDFRYDPDGTMHVYAGTWNELSLLTAGAFAGANVSAVTASPPTTNPEGATMPDQLLDDTELELELGPPEGDEPDGEQPDDDDTPTIQAGRPVPARAPGVPLRAGANRARPVDLGIHGVAQLISAGKKRGLRGSQIDSRIQAAFMNVLSSDVPGFVRPAFRTDIVGLIDPGMPLVRAIQQRPLPASGMRIEYPVWSAPPDAYAQQVGEKTAIASGPVQATVQGDDILTWAQGNDISFQTMDRSDPSFIDAYIRAAAIDAGIKYDTYVANRLLAVAAAGTPGTSFVDNVQALFAALDWDATPPGPMFLAMSGDIAVSMIGVTGLDGPAFWDAGINLGTFDPSTSAGGLNIFTDRNLPAGTMLLGASNAAANYGGPDTSANVRVVDVSLLGMDIGVYFYAALAVEYPGAFAKLTGVVTAAGARTSNAAKK
jgi:hypothetical protein